MTARRFVAVLLALWAGNLITVCGLVAPSLFAVLERPLAGRVAAHLFLMETIVGVVVAILVFVVQRLVRFELPRAVAIAILIGAIAPLTSELILGPMMHAARSAGDMTRFGALHGVSAFLFVVACSSALVAAWRFNRPGA